ncbi:MAG: response regulator [Algisphaera sp.]
MQALVIDDSEVIRNMYQRCLAPLGFSEVVEATDGLDGLQQLEKITPDIVLLDWNMPRMCGIQFLKKVRLTQPDLPVIMVSSLHDRAQVMDAIRAGVNDYLIKPFNVDDLADRITHVIERNRQRKH